MYSDSLDRILSEEEIMSCLQLKDDVNVVREVELTDGTIVEVKCESVVVV